MKLKSIFAYTNDYKYILENYKKSTQKWMILSTLIFNTYFIGSRGECDIYYIILSIKRDSELSQGRVLLIKVGGCSLLWVLIGVSYPLF